MRTYLAITTTNSAHGYRVVAYGANKTTVAQKAREIIGDVATEVGTDLYAVTEHANLRVVSKSVAKRKFGIDYDDSESWWLNCRDAVRA